MAAVLSALGGAKGIMPVLQSAAGLVMSRGGNAAKKGGSLSVEIFGYDFVQLLIKIAIFYAIGYGIAKLFELIIYGTSWVKGVLTFFGVGTPNKDQIPDSVKQLFTTGYYGVTFWDMVNAMAVALIVWEGMRYYDNNKKAGGEPSAFTLGIFSLMAGGIGALTIPTILNHIKTDTNKDALTAKEITIYASAQRIGVNQTAGYAGVVFNWQNAPLIDRPITIHVQSTIGTDLATAAGKTDKDGTYLMGVSGGMPTLLGTNLWVYVTTDNPDGSVTSSKKLPLYIDPIANTTTSGTTLFSGGVGV